MRSFVSAALAAAMLTGGCSSGWWRDPPPAPTGTLPPAEPGAPATNYATPDSPGAPYAPPGQARAPVAQGAWQPAERAPIGAGSSQRAAAYDNVGYAIWSADTGGVSAAHGTLPPGTFAEVTELASGRTILLPITGVARPGHEIELSGAAARELGLQGKTAPVRVRIGNASGADLAALQAGRPAVARPDTPPVLLNALRRKLDGSLGRVTSDGEDLAPKPATGRPTPRPPVATTIPKATPKPAPTVARSGPGYYVQVAALSDTTRARTLARQLGGTVASAGGFHRVRLGPYDSMRAAQAARDDAARRGYGDARIVRE